MVSGMNTMMISSTELNFVMGMWKTDNDVAKAYKRAPLFCSPSFKETCFCKYQSLA